MFKSITYRKYLGYNKETDLYSYEYEIVDTEFTETAVGAVAAAAAAVALALAVAAEEAAVINIYSKRNLNVAKNLVIYLKYAEKHWRWEIPELISWCKQYTPNFSKYEQDIHKYLLLI